MIENIELIKMYSWEIELKNRIEEIRKKELYFIKTINYYKAFV